MNDKETLSTWSQRNKPYKRITPEVVITVWGGELKEKKALGECEVIDRQNSKSGKKKLG